VPNPNYKTYQVIVGAAQLWYGADDAEPPAAVEGADYVTTLNADSDWTHAGWTQEGVEVAYEADYGEVEVDQLKSPVRYFNQGLTVTLNTNLAEATLQNLALAWGAPNVTGDTFNIADPSDSPVERRLLVVGPAPRKTGAQVDEARQRIYTAWKCISMEGSTHALRRTEATVFPVSFRLMPDASKAGNEYGTIVDRYTTYDASP
jgi:hypothetical protein